jgi:hypothetical protein
MTIWNVRDTARQVIVTGVWYNTKRRNDRLSNPVMAGLVPAIPTRTGLAKDAIPLSKHPMPMAGTSPAMTGLAAREVRQ